MGDAALVYEAVGGVAAALLVATLLFVAVRRIKRKPATHVEQYQLVNTKDLYLPDQTVSLPTQVGLERDEESGLLIDPCKPLSYGGLTKANSETNQTLTYGGLNKANSKTNQTLTYGGLNKANSETNQPLNYGGLTKPNSETNQTLTYGGLNKANSETNQPLTYGGLNKANSETNQPLTYGGLNKANSETNQPLTYGGLNKANSETNQPLTYGGLNKANSETNQPLTYGGLTKANTETNKESGVLKYPYKPLIYGALTKASSETNLTKVGGTAFPFPSKLRTRHDCGSTTSLDSLDNIPLHSPTSLKHQTCIEFNLVWVSLESHLSVYVTRLTNLPPRLCKQATATITLTLQSDGKEVSHSANKQYKGVNPDINHVFTLSDVSLEEVQNSTLLLHLSVRRQAHIHKNPVGELSYSLCNAHLQPDTPLITTLPITPKGPATPTPWNKAGRDQPDGGTQHQFQARTYKSPTFCTICTNFIYVTQGMQCQVCKLNIHSKCEIQVRANCSTETSHVVEQKKPEDSDVVVPHHFEVHSYKSPTGCAYCSRMLYGLWKQGKQCQVCKMNIHIKCEEHIACSCSGEQAAALTKK